MDITPIVNAALDRMRREEDLTEEALAKQLGVELSTLWRWRNGKNISKSARILIPLVVKGCSQPVEQAA